MSKITTITTEALTAAIAADEQLDCAAFDAAMLGWAQADAGRKGTVAALKAMAIVGSRLGLAYGPGTREAILAVGQRYMLDVQDMVAMEAAEAAGYDWLADL